MSLPRLNLLAAGLITGAMLMFGAGCNPPAQPGPSGPGPTSSAPAKGSPSAQASPGAKGSPVTKGPGSPALAPSGMGAVAPTGTPDGAHVIHAFVSDTELKPRVFVLPANQAQVFAFKNLGTKAQSVRIEGEGIKREVQAPIQPNQETTLDGNLAPGTYKMIVPGEEGKDAFVGQVTVK